MNGDPNIISDLQLAFGNDILATQVTQDSIDTVWVRGTRIVDVLRHLKHEIDRPFQMLFDLTAIDERNRQHREGQPAGDFTIVYYLLSYDRNRDIRLKVPLVGEYPTVQSATSVWSSANWYEREVWDMFGVTFDGHPNLRRILMPRNWRGHPLRREHPARRTEMPPFDFSEAQREAEEEVMRFKPEEWGMRRSTEFADFMFLNLGPQHPGTHGVLRIILQLDGEIIVDAVPDIGYHHRAKEKMGERQTWHTYIPYTDRVDYLQGVLNNLAYVRSVEALGGIEVPDRANVIRVMLSELYRISSHLVWYGTFAQDVGAMSPVFYMFTDRERLLGITEAVCGGRLHPNWFRIGGVAQDLPEGWETLVRDFVEYLPARLREYDKLVMQNRIFKARTQGIGQMTLSEALDWGATGPALRACGLEWDFRKKRPYSGYDQFEFEIPTAQHGDCYDRAVVRVEEMRQSLRIIKQCLENMPEGPYKSSHHLTTPPLKGNTMHDIETLINHFLNVSWGPVFPSGEAMKITEVSKGAAGYYLVSDGNTVSYRTRIRTPSFPHMQMLPLLTRGLMIPDLMAILGAMDYVLSDVDR